MEQLKIEKHQKNKFKMVALVLMTSILLAILTLLWSNTAYGVGIGYSKCMVEVTSGRVLYAENMDLRLPMASTTKAMTALLASESGKLGEVVTVTKATVGIEGSSIYLREGDKITLEALTYGLMLRSGNDAAETIATYLAGSVENFAEEMNRRAQKLGLKNTHFVNPHGLHDKDHFTSAYDLAMISAEGLKNKNFKKIVATKSITFDQNGKKWSFINKNKLLFQYSGGIGVKTGFTKAAGRCLIAASERDNLAVVAVVLNVPPMFEECTRLMNLAHKNYEMKAILPAGKILTSAPIEGISYKKVPLTVKNSVFYPVKKDGSDKIDIKFNTIREIPAKCDPEMDCGVAQVLFDNRLLFSQNLFMIR